MRRFLRRLALAAPMSIASAGLAGASEGEAEDGWWRPASYDALCGGECRATGFVGRFLDTNMTDVFLPIDPDFAPPWQWRMPADHIVSGALSRRLGSFGGVLDLEAEVGLGQRIGEPATEVWGALYARWTEFPWNDAVRTSIAISTGLNYASRVTPRERERSAGPEESELMHYLSPEITLAPASWERTDLVLRFHHRSGGGQIWGDGFLFNGASEGAQYLKIGIRRAF
ncbi:MAG: hypothetical protein AAF763_01895 [Pseudomonadota bacterium]